MISINNNDMKNDNAIISNIVIIINIDIKYQISLLK